MISKDMKDMKDMNDMNHMNDMNDTNGDTFLLHDDYNHIWVNDDVTDPETSPNNGGNRVFRVTLPKMTL